MTSARPPTTLTAPQMRDRLAADRVMAIARGDHPSAIVSAVEVLVQAGMSLVEISLTGDDALAAIRECAARFGTSISLGAGTVLTAIDAVRAVDAGASYLVTPALGAGVDAGLDAGVAVLAGVQTPSEVLHAWQHGAAAAKLFPASLGGVEYLRALRAPFPNVAFVPVGGVGLPETRAYLAAGAFAVGVGTPLFQDALTQRDLSASSASALRARAAEFLSAAKLGADRED